MPEYEQCREYIDPPYSNRCVQTATSAAPHFAGHDHEGKLVVMQTFTCARGHHYDVEVVQP